MTEVSLELPVSDTDSRPRIYRVNVAQRNNRRRVIVGSMRASDKLTRDGRIQRGLSFRCAALSLCFQFCLTHCWGCSQTLPATVKQPALAPIGDQQLPRIRFLPVPGTVWGKGDAW